MNKKVNGSLLALAIVSASTSTMAIDPAVIDLGGVNMAPTLSLSTGYDDNPFSTTDSSATPADGTMVTVIQPSLLFIAQQGKNVYSANFDITRGIFHDSTDDNYTDYSAQIAADLFFSSKHGLVLGAGVADGHEDRGSGSTQGVSEFISGPVEYQDSTFNAAYTYGSPSSQARLVLSADYLSKTFDNFASITRDRERDDISLSAKLLYALSADTDITAEVVSTSIEYDNEAVVERSGDEMEYFVGMEWQATAKTSGYAKIGVGDKEFDSATRQDPGTEVSWDAGVVWEPKSYSSLTVFTSKEEEETVSTGNFIDQTSYGVSWDHGWTDQVSTNLSYSLLNQDYVGSSQDDDIDNFSASVSYAFARWLDIGLAYEYTDKSSTINDPLASLEYDRQKVILSFDISL